MKKYFTIALLMILSHAAIAEPMDEPVNLKIAGIKPIPFQYPLRGRTNITVGAKYGDYTVISNKTTQITLERDGKTITLLKGHQVPRDNYEVVFVDGKNRKQQVRMGEVFAFGTRQLKLTKIDYSGSRCFVEDMQSKEVILIKATPNKSIVP